MLSLSLKYNILFPETFAQTKSSLKSRMHLKRLNGFEVKYITKCVLHRPLHTSHARRAIEYLPCPGQYKRDVNPVVVLFGWLLAKSRHLEKYGTLYQEQGLDVVSAKLEIMEVLRPKKAEQVAVDILEILSSTDHREKPILIHGFSVGGYLYSQVLNKMETTAKYASVKKRIVGQVFDSPVDFVGIPKGVSNAASTNPMLRLAMKLAITSYLNLTSKYTERVFTARSKLFHNTPVRSPSLFLYSRDDRIADIANIQAVEITWRSRLGMRVVSKCWDSSPHVSHFHVHQEEYIDTLKSFLNEIKLHSSGSLQY